MTAARFAFYGRVSTEDRQDPTSSKQWQRARAESILPAGGEIVREYFDIGQSRSQPWKRRPKASDLLTDLKDPSRGWSAVVIGEPARAFSGIEFGLIFPLFTNRHVELWVPEVGGRVDPGSEAHDLVMSLYGGMSKGERNRIKVRVRSAMSEQAKHQGRFLGGRPPYGFVLGDAGPHPNPSKAAHGQRLHKLDVDPTAAKVVRRIFNEYISGRGYLAIARDLTRDGIPSPSAADPARNRHRDMRSWSKIAVRSILQNPRYTGREVWGKQRRTEELFDEDDAAQGYKSRMRWNDRSDWIWSTEQTHKSIIDSETFAQAQAQMAAGSHRPNSDKTKSTGRTYVLSGRVHCGVCGHRMQGNPNHGENHYRCRYPRDFAPAAGMNHPRTVYVRESAIVPKLDEWIATLFAPENLDETCQALAEAGGAADADHARIEAARRKLADCDRRLGGYQKTLDAGADPVIVAGWISQVQGERLRAERDLAAAQPSGRLTPKQARALVDGLKDIASVLAGADPKLKAKLYEELGITVRYDPSTRIVIAQSRPEIACATVRVGGGT